MSVAKADSPKGYRGRWPLRNSQHGEAGVILSGGPPPVPELERYGPIPAPLEGQTLADGSPASATFEESYREYCRPLDEYEAEYGAFHPGVTATEDGLLDLVGLKGVDLGRSKGADLLRDEANRRSRRHRAHP